MRNTLDRKSLSAFVALVALLSGVFLAPARASSGGPDAGGYSFKDSNEPGGPSYNFVDVSGTGVPLFLGDDSATFVPIGFSFSFYGAAYASVSVCSNGYISFTLGSCSYSSTVFPGSYIGAAVAAYWADLYETGGSSITYQTLGVSPSRVFVVEWKDVPHYNGSSPVTMEIKLFEADGAVEVHYASTLAGGYSNSAGIEDQTQAIGLQYCRPCSDLSNIAVRYQGGAAVVPAPQVTGPSSAILGQPVTLTATSTDPNPPDVAYVFDWKDGSPAERIPAAGFVGAGTPESSTHTYATVGCRSVQVHYENTDGASSLSAYHQVCVTLPPPPGLPDVQGPSKAFVGYPVTVTATSTTPAGQDIRYAFSWDGAPVHYLPAAGYVASGTPEAETKTFKAPGPHFVTVYAVDVYLQPGPGARHDISILPSPDLSARAALVLLDVPGGSVSQGVSHTTFPTVQATVSAGVPAESLDVADTGTQTSKSSLTKREAVAELSGPVATGAAATSVVGLLSGLPGPDYGRSEGSTVAGDVTIVIPSGPTIVARGISVSGQTTCLDSTSDVHIAYLSVDGVVLVDGNVTPPPNTVVGDPSTATVTLNRQVPVAGTPNGQQLVAVAVEVAGVGTVLIGGVTTSIQGCA